MPNLHQFLTREEKDTLIQLYHRRAELAKAISSLEQLEALRLRRLREFGNLSLTRVRVA